MQNKKIKIHLLQEKDACVNFKLYTITLQKIMRKQCPMQSIRTKSNSEYCDIIHYIFKTSIERKEKT